VKPHSYSAVVPTIGKRNELLRATLQSLACQTRRPEAVWVADASSNSAALETVNRFLSAIPVFHVKCAVASTGAQRNAGAEHVTSDLVLFCDDDLTFEPDFMQTLCEPLDQDDAGQVGGVAGRMEGLSHPVPHGLYRFYCRLQAGYDHPHYGARLFGAAQNFYPCYERQLERWIQSEWLNSGCVIYRTGVFRSNRFPLFPGYGFMEDAHQSARVARTHRLYFHREAVFQHHGTSTSTAYPPCDLARLQLRNREVIAREVLGLRPATLVWKFLLYRLFVTVALLRSRSTGWMNYLTGLWT
jgi:glycosyltransferase involved in cell wall biosynthesis